MQTEQERRAAMYPALMSRIEKARDILQTKVTLRIDLCMDERLILADMREAMELDERSKTGRNAHVHPVMAQALNGFSARDAALVALVQSEVPDFLARPLV